MRRKSLLLFCGFWFLFSAFGPQSAEIRDETHTQVIIREHPKTGKSYVSIVSIDFPVPRDPFTHQRNRYSRPDYRMLDPKVKAKDISYDGPYNDRKKVYLFGATLMTVGVVGGTAAMALAPASTAASGALSTGGGAYLAAGAGVAAGSGLAVHEVTKVRPEDEHFTHESESRTVGVSNKPQKQNQNGG